MVGSGRSEVLSRVEETWDSRKKRCSSKVVKETE